MNRSCSEDSIPNFQRSVVFDPKLAEVELTFPNPVHQFDTWDGDRGVPKALQSKHGA
jgi:hypothetical protein